MGKSVSRKEVAERAGVSESTVSRALNDSPLISDAIKDKVKKVAEELDYYPSRTASLFASKKSYTIGMVVPSYQLYKNITPFSRLYFPILLDGLLKGATPKGYTITIIIEDNLGKYKSYSELVKAHCVDGLIFSISNDHDMLYRLYDEKIPYVLVSNYMEGLPSVYALPDQGMKQACEHARQLGHNTIGYITGDLNYNDGRDRLITFERYCAEYHLVSEIVLGDFSKHSGYDAFGKFKHDPSLIMTGNDREAFGFMQACNEHHIYVPKHLSLIGFDNFQDASVTAPALTTVDHPVMKMGEFAADLLISQIENTPVLQRQIWCETSLIVRNTTRVYN